MQRSPAQEKSEQLQLLSRVINSPDVLPFVAPGYFALDADAFFENPENCMYGDDRGLILFVQENPHIYAMHYLLGDKLRGPEGFRRIKEAIADLFTKRDVYAITGATPRDNLTARAVNRALHGRPIGVSVDSCGRPCINYILERSTWAHFSGAQ